MNIYDHFHKSLRINDKASSTTQVIPIQSQADSNKHKDDVEFDLCDRFYTKRDFPRHTNKCVKKPGNHLANK